MKTYSVLVEFQVDADSAEAATARIEGLVQHAMFPSRDNLDWDWERVSTTEMSTVKL